MATAAQRAIPTHNKDAKIRVEESQQIDMPPPRDWSSESVQLYVGEIVRKVMKNPNIQDSDDLFQQGCYRCVHLSFALRGLS